MKHDGVTKTAGITADAIPVYIPAAARQTGQSRDYLCGLGLRSMLLRPIYVAQSAWTEHVPFAFWLTEALRPRVFVELGTHYGMSYFGFCQAVEKLDLDTTCYAVDTWKGDEHAGLYGEEVLAAVRGHNQKHYTRFSTLVRSTFDAAVTSFADGSIDLLHIDGLHTYEAVKHDFDSWLPKMSEKGVIVLHDIAVRERNFGVYRLMQELRGRYPCFEFLHGHGLGVVGVGARQEPLLTALFEAGRDREATHELRHGFSQLGLACTESQLRHREAASQKTLRDQLAGATQKTGELAAQLQDLRSETEQLQAVQASARAEAGRIGERLARETAQLQITATELAQRDSELARCETELASRDSDLANLRTDLESQRTRGADLEARLAVQTQELATLARLLIDSEAQLRQTEARIAGMAAERTADRKSLSREQEKSAGLSSSKTALEHQVRELEHRLGELQTHQRALLDSTSWRITEPLRRLMRLMRRG